MKSNWPRIALRALCISLCISWMGMAQDPQHRPEGNQIPGPGQLTGEQGWKSDPSADFDAWLKDLKAWRHEQLIRMGYTTPSTGGRNFNGRSATSSSRR